VLHDIELVQDRQVRFTDAGNSEVLFRREKGIRFPARPFSLVLLLPRLSLPAQAGQHANEEPHAAVLDVRMVRGNGQQCPAREGPFRGRGDSVPECSLLQHVHAALLPSRSDGDDYTTGPAACVSLSLLLRRVRSIIRVRERGNEDHAMSELRTMSDERLVALLFTEGDRLEQAVVDEVLRRGGLTERLGGIVADAYNWNEPLPAWWAVVHAVYILGALGTAETVLPLLRSLRYGEACENDWVTEDLPSIFGRIGLPAVDGLKSIAADRTAGWLARTIAFEGLAAVTIGNPAASEDLFSFIHRFFIDAAGERALRQMAGHVLLDFLRSEYRAELAAFGREERALADRNGSYKPAFTDEDVEREFSRNEPDRARYTRDWLGFYRPEAIAERQERWDNETRERAEEPGQHSPHELCPFAADGKKKKCCLGRVGLA
jgi:hypothetical protein